MPYYSDSEQLVMLNGAKIPLGTLRDRLRKKLVTKQKPDQETSTISDSNEAVRLSFEEQEYSVSLGVVPDQPDKPSTLCVYGNGTHLLRENPIGQFFRKIDSHKMPSLPSGPAPFFKMALPKVPLHILRTQIAFYRAVMRDFAQSEAYTLILWDLEKEEYLLYCPVQKVSGAAVDYTFDVEQYPSSRYLQVVSCHSHNSMGAFFSGTDDGDEKADMLYCVMGKLDQMVPTHKTRANLKGKQACFLELSDVFDVSEAEFEELSPLWKPGASQETLFPDDWLAKVTSAGAVQGVQGAYALAGNPLDWHSYMYNGAQTRRFTGYTPTHFNPHPFPRTTALAQPLKDLITALKTAEPPRTYHRGQVQNNGVLNGVVESDALEAFILAALQEGFCEEMMDALHSYLLEEEEIEGPIEDLSYLDEFTVVDDCDPASLVVDPFSKDWSFNA